MNQNEPSFEVGYGKPPRASRFTKGQSGNPKGRPKGSKNLAAVVLRECRQRVRVNGPGGSRTVTKLEAAVMQISNKAAQGEFRAARELFALVQRSEIDANSERVPDSFQETDQSVLENLVRRIQNLNTEQASSDNSRGTE